jgi:hypothetical protein
MASIDVKLIIPDEEIEFILLKRYGISLDYRLADLSVNEDGTLIATFSGEVGKHEQE